jgi:hypothetical protein
MCRGQLFALKLTFRGVCNRGRLGRSCARSAQRKLDTTASRRMQRRHASSASGADEASALTLADYEFERMSLEVPPAAGT